MSPNTSALRQEAAAWRRVARIADSLPIALPPWKKNDAIADPFRGTPLWTRMFARNKAHDTTLCGEGPATPAEARDIAVLRALFLALECDDEAREVIA